MAPGNWFEERAQPLKGVIADYGFVRCVGVLAAVLRTDPDTAPCLAAAAVCLFYGFQNETTTTTKTTHRRPAKDAQFQRLIAKPRIRCGMVTPDTLAEARISWYAL